MYKLPEDRIWVSVFESDDESEKIWKEVVGVPNDRIIRMGEEDNFWASGPTGTKCSTTIVHSTCQARFQYNLMCGVDV